MKKQYKILKKKKKVGLEHIFPPIVFGILVSWGLYDKGTIIVSQIFIGVLLAFIMCQFIKESKSYTKENLILRN